MQTLTIYRQTQFQSTLPRGERLANAYETINRNRISIHAPTRGATQIDRCIDVNLIFQSTLPRGERRLPETWLTFSL